MKARNMFHRGLGWMILSLLTWCLLVTPHRVMAQEVDSGAATYSRAELTQMLAPIALYPDALLSQVLMASTYPIEVVEADRWVRKNSQLKGDALDAALLDQAWDPSVKSLCHFPSVLATMSERISETTSIGNAFLAQEGEVMDTVQDLRARAYAEGNLNTNARQNVLVERETIVIQPANPRVIYVPYYDPFTVYGSWWYPAYPPWYWRPAGVSIGFGISYWPGVYFGFTFGSWSYFDWPRRYIHIDVHRRPRFVRRDRWIVRKPGRWHHAPVHRRGVAYRDRSTARRYGQAPRRVPTVRRDVRGFPERRGDDRTRIRRDDRTRVERHRQEQQRIERELRTRRQTESVRPPQGQASSGPPSRQRVEQGRQLRTPTRREVRQPQQPAAPSRQTRQPRQTGQPGQPAERGRTVQRRTVRERPAQQKAPRASAPRQQQQQKSQDNVFNRVDSGRQERVSSERGRASRQGRDSGSRGGGSRTPAGRSGR